MICKYNIGNMSIYVELDWNSAVYNTSPHCQLVASISSSKLLIIHFPSQIHCKVAGMFCCIESQCTGLHFGVTGFVVPPRPSGQHVLSAATLKRGKMGGRFGMPNIFLLTSQMAFLVLYYNEHAWHICCILSVCQLSFCASLPALFWLWWSQLK